MLDSVLELLVEIAFRPQHADDPNNPSWQEDELLELELVEFDCASRGWFGSHVWHFKITKKGETYLKQFGDQRRLALVYLRLEKFSQVCDRMKFFSLEELPEFLAHSDASIRINALVSVARLTSETSKSASKDGQS